MIKAEKIKYLLVPAIGFGIGGALLGLVGTLLFQDIKIGVILWGLFGSASLVLLENIKVYKKVLITLTGTIIWIAVIFISVLAFVGFGFADSLPFDSKWIATLVVPLGFLSGPLLISLFYAIALGLVLKIRMWPVFWRGTIGLFFLPIPLFGLAFENSINVILGFLLVGTIFGLFLGWGRCRGQQLKETEAYNKEKT